MSPLPRLTYKPAEAAEVLGVSMQQLALWRCRGGGPRWSKPSPRLVLYTHADLVAWLEQHKQGRVVA